MQVLNIIPILNYLSRPKWIFLSQYGEIYIQVCEAM